MSSGGGGYQQQQQRRFGPASMTSPTNPNAPHDESSVGGKITGCGNEPVTADRARMMMSEAQGELAELIETIRIMIDTKIEEAAARNFGAIYFRVPVTIFGYGPYNVTKVGKKIAEDLFRSGFSIYGTAEFFKVAWSREEIIKSDPKAIKQMAMRQCNSSSIGAVDEVDEMTGDMSRILNPETWDDISASGFNQEEYLPHQGRYVLAERQVNKVDVILDRLRKNLPVDGFMLDQSQKKGPVNRKGKQKRNNRPVVAAAVASTRSVPKKPKMRPRVSFTTFSRDQDANKQNETSSSSPTTIRIRRPRINL